MMADTDLREGTVPFKVPHIDTPCHTYYKIIGDLSSNSPRLIVLHGGPGTGHEYLLPFGRLWQQFGIPVVFYDQIGCAASTHLPQTAGDESFWQESLFLAELDNLLDSLQLRNGPGYHILGHSWGGRIAAAFAATQPQGLQQLVLASGISSSQSYVEGIQILRRQLPSDTQLAIDEGIEEEQKGNFDSARFREAMNVFFRNYFCRTEPFPPKELLLAFKNMNEDKTVRETMSVYSVTIVESVLSLIPAVVQISPLSQFNSRTTSLQSPTSVALSLTLLQSGTITFELHGFLPGLDLHSTPASNCSADACV
jgi:proline-specific peptidase